jgi:hypothetical protein
MIILTKGTRVIDIVKSVEGNKVVRWNDNELIYGNMANFTQTEIEAIPEELDKTNFNSYNYENGVFTKIKKIEWNKLEFLALFTKEQRVTIWDSTDINVKDFVIFLTNATTVRTDNPETVGALQYLLANNFITQEQYNEII